MKSFIYSEMMVHVPLCTHKNPENILLIADDADSLTKELERYKDCKVQTLKVKDALEAIREFEDNSFDIVLCENYEDVALLAHISRVSKEDALIAMTHPHLDEIEANTTLMKTLSRDFKIIMPYNAGENTLILASKEYHPTADIILQRSDLLEGQKYYNCDIHVASFAMGNYIRKNYLGVIKN